MSDNPELFSAILARRSVRRYEAGPLTDIMLAQVRALVDQALPLIPQNRLHVSWRDDEISAALLRVLGGYGRLVQPPHLLVPSIDGGQHSLMDLGYRVEQIAVRLVLLGLGSCYIGVLRNEPLARTTFGLSPQARLGALLAYGQASQAVGGRAFNALVRLSVRADRRLPVERIFFIGQYDRPGAPPAEIAPLVEAARVAPSAVNAQPWRILWRDGAMLLYVVRHSARYGSGPTADYRLFDGGICMGNVTLAMEALGLSGRWAMLSDVEASSQEHPEEWQPLARLTLH